jgi:hypothetical protein
LLLKNRPATFSGDRWQKAVPINNDLFLNVARVVRVRINETLPSKNAFDFLATVARATLKALLRLFDDDWK